MKLRRRREHRRRQRRERKSLEIYKKSKGLYRHLAYLFITHDPMGLYDEKYCNIDEYDPEIYSIMPGLPHCSNEEDVLELVYNVFGEWFGEAQGSKERYVAVSRKVWDFWCGRESPEYQSSDTEVVTDTSKGALPSKVCFDRKTKIKTLSKARYFRKKRTGDEYQFLFYLRKNKERKILRQCIAGRCIVDFGIPWRNLLIHVEKESCDAHKSRSAARVEWLKNLGFNVVSATEENIRETPFDVLQQMRCFEESAENRVRFDKLLRTAMRQSYHK